MALLYGISLDTVLRVRFDSSFMRLENALNLGPEASPGARSQHAMGEEEPAVITHQLECASLAGRDPSPGLTHLCESNGHFFLVYARNAVCQYVHIVITSAQEIQDGLQHANVRLGGDRGSITNSIEAPGNGSPQAHLDSKNYNRLEAALFENGLYWWNDH